MSSISEQKNILSRNFHSFGKGIVFALEKKVFSAGEIDDLAVSGFFLQQRFDGGERFVVEVDEGVVEHEEGLFFEIQLVYERKAYAKPDQAARPQAITLGFAIKAALVHEGFSFAVKL